MSVQQTIENLLADAFSPNHLQVQNESHQHKTEPGAESHFKVVIATEQFQGKPLIQRHRAVNEALQEILSNHIHALALHTYTPEEWAEQQQAPDSPKCRGGSA